ncbi:MAG: LPP20 family lipoprotein [Candidatus Cloacimonadaceae bacterium]|nr:LPP20 family lipoprotein [Candidatus Cloacimonadaceae bacterium]
MTAPIFASVKPPLWITQHPNESGYYIGIGRSIIAGNKDYQNQAKNAAYNDIATQIEVYVKGESESKFTEDTGVVRDYSMTRTQTSTDVKIENIELVDSWSNKKEYWVYYRLSKAEYQRIRSERIESALNIGRGFYEQSLENLEKSLYVVAIQNLYLAFNAISPYIGETLKVASWGKEINLDQKIIQMINELQNNVLIEFASSAVNCKKGKDIDISIPLLVSMLMNNNKVPISGIPISFIQIGGLGKVTNYAVTDAAGKIDFKISKMYLRSQDDCIEASINMDSLLTSIKSRVARIYYPDFKPAKGILRIYCQPLKVKISELNTDLQNRLINKATLSSFIEKSLVDIGIQTVDNDSADLFITINSSCYKGKQISGMEAVTVLVEVDLSITDSLTGTEYYREKMVNQKGVASNYEEAQRRAFQNIGLLLQTQVIPQRIAALFNN